MKLLSVSVYAAFLALGIINWWEPYLENFTWRWAGVAVFYAGAIAIYLSLCDDFLGDWLRSRTKSEKRLTHWLFFFCSLAVVPLYVYKLSSLPYSSIGDGVRDGAFLARGFMDKILINPWNPGFYGGYAMVLPWANVPIEYLIPRDNLSVRLTPLVITCAGLTIFFLTACKHLGYFTGALTAIVYGAMPFIAWNTRSEMLVALNALLLMPALLWLLEPEKAPDWRTYFKIGFVGGIVAYFHIAAAVAWIVVSAIAGGINVLMARLRGLKLLPFLAAAYAAGFALAQLPRLHYFLPTLREAFHERFRPAESLTEKILGLFAGYIDPILAGMFRSICVYHAPASCFIPFSAFHGVLVALGIAAVLLIRPWRRIGDAACALALACLLVTNGSASNRGFAPHALMPLVPFIGYLAGRGLALLAAPLKDWKLLARARIGTLPLFAAAAVVFAVLPYMQVLSDIEAYESQPENRIDNVTYELGRTIRKARPAEPIRCLATNDREMANNLVLLHVREQIGYYGGISTEYNIHAFENGPPRLIIAAAECPRTTIDGVFTTIRKFGDWTFMIAAPQSAAAR